MVFGMPVAIRTHELERRSYQAWLQNAGLMRVLGLVGTYPKPFDNGSNPRKCWAGAYFAK